MPIKINHPVPSDIEVAQAAELRPILDIAQDVGLDADDLELYGKYKAKVHLDVRDRLKNHPQGKYIDVTAITPTPLGEGKTTTTVGLSQALGFIKKQSVFTCIRQPSMGPTFGIKGGAAGGGYSQIVPMEDFNLHLTGDIHAITAANNLLAAQIDARMLHERAITDDEKLAKALCPDGAFAPSIAKRAARLGIKARDGNIARTLDELSAQDKRRLFRLDIDPNSITWQRVMDINDRLLRKIQVGRGDDEKGNERITGFDITVASRNHGDSRFDDFTARHARTFFADGDWHEFKRRTGHRRRFRRRGRDHCFDERRDHAQLDADAGRHARVRPRRTFCEYRARQFVHRRGPDRIETCGLCCDRIRFRRGHWHGKIHGHQVPLLGLDSERRRARRHGARAQDARRRTKSGGGASARQGVHGRKSRFVGSRHRQFDSPHREHEKIRRAGCRRYQFVQV
ncbi:MAG: formate--tetrahydrofolate ligase [Chloroflexi bacterium]|nr:formate--tetrahydrofolate ligase [Chloroflexota bacterium]